MVFRGKIFLNCDNNELERSSNFFYVSEWHRWAVVG